MSPWKSAKKKAKLAGNRNQKTQKNKPSIAIATAQTNLVVPSFEKMNPTLVKYRRIILNAYSF
jgi:hypothetical protein